MARIHDKYVIELKEVIKGYGNDPQVKDPLRFPCDYKFYEIDGVAICENSFKKMKRLEDVAIPKAEYKARLKADMVAMLEELKAEIEELYPKARKTYRDGLTSYCEGVDDSREIIQQKIDKLKENIEEAVLHIITERDTGGQNGR